MRDSPNPLHLHVFLVETREYGSTLQLDEDEVRTRFTPLQLGVFHSLSGLNHGSHCRPAPPGVPTRETREETSRAALEAHRVRKPKIMREFPDIRRRQNVIGQVYDVSDPFRRVRYPDEDWEFNRPGLNQRLELAVLSVYHVLKRDVWLERGRRQRGVQSSRAKTEERAGGDFGPNRLLKRRV